MSTQEGLTREPMTIGGHMVGVLIIVVICLIGLVLRGLHQIREDERGIVQRFGAFRRTEAPGLRFILPGVEYVTRISAKTLISTGQCRENCRTKDGVKLRVGYIVRLRAVDAAKALLKVDDWREASLVQADAAVRSAIGTRTVKDILAQWPQLGVYVSADLSEVTCIWGVLAEVEITSAFPLDEIGIVRNSSQIA
jgi:regulator of protease activity HflC (stomatin/prohibitin superfamily)